MKATSARAVDPNGAEMSQSKETRAESVSPSLDKIDDRATTTTEVLVEILAQENHSYVRHWGLNE